jgi:hypothetical protein
VRALSVLLASTLAVGAAAVVAATPAAAATAGAGRYVAITPFRAVDTRTGTGAHRRPLAHGSKLVATIGGRHKVPKHVAALALTITAAAPTSSGTLTVYSATTKRPAGSNLRYRKDETSSVSAIVHPSASGRVSVYNSARAGRTQVVIDVSGYYVAGGASGSDPGTLHPVAPARVLAARGVAAHRSLVVAVGGHRGVPRSGVGAVAVSITALSPARSGGLEAYASGSRSGLTTMSFVRGQSRSQFAIVATDSAGRISIYNASPGRVRVAVDVVGYFVAGFVTRGGKFQPRVPDRIVSGARLGSHKTKTVKVAGRDGVPLANASAVLVTLTAGTPKRDGSLVAWAAGTRRPGVTSLQFQGGHTQSVATLVRVSSAGTIAVRNGSTAAISLSVDIGGYVQKSTITPPRTSNSRYIRTIGELTDSFADPSTTGDGCVDATAGSTLVLLQFGAQSNDKQGVVLSGTTTKVSYPDLVAAIDKYLSGFTACSPPARAAIALGTNNDGDFSLYSATARGTDWANRVVDAVTPHTGITILGANDIEPGFASTRAQAQAWETAYLAATGAGLIFNGSADGCSSTFGETHGSCAYDWTQWQIYNLAHNGTRIQALPQVYDRFQAAQWANIDATGGGGLIFAGSLTEYQACPAKSSACPEASFRPADGWTALQHAISTVVRSPRIPAATDLRADG